MRKEGAVVKGPTTMEYDQYIKFLISKWCLSNPSLALHYSGMKAGSETKIV